MMAIDSNANDWPRFRGPHGSGIAVDSDSLPTEWSRSQNIAWKSPLPGPGASSPIIVGTKVLVTCYSGYGLDRQQPGQVEDLVRHIICFDLRSGKQIWQRDVKATLPEDLYDKTGVSSHGYASHTPVSDGENVYCFFGKSGIHAFDLSGNKLWAADTGQGSDPPKWGSSSSPIVHDSTLIVTAAAESQSIIGFDKATGRQLWKYKSRALDGTWGTPTIVKVSPDRKDLVLLVPKELWGLDPHSGKVRWRTEADGFGQAYTNVISHEKRIYVFSGQGGGGLAMDLSQKEAAGNATAEKNPLWKSNVYTTYATPVLHGNKIYVVSRGVLTVVAANSGKRLQQVRLRGAKKFGNKRFGSLDYASPVIAGQNLYWLNAKGQTFVFELGEQLKQLSINDLSAENEVFWGSPAIARNKMVIRSSKFVYCIGR